MKTFLELGLSERAVACLLEVGISEPTEVQAASIGLALAKKDVLASAETGSGKTAAYALPIIERLGGKRRQTRALVLVPTRELCLQVKGQFELLGKYAPLRAIALYGGTGFETQRRALRRGADVIVATPGRLLDMLRQGMADLSALEILVFDEADRMMDMGFMPQVRSVVAQVPKQRQTLMFSATIDQRITQIAGEFLVNPSIVKCNSQRVDPAQIDQHLHHVHEFGKDAMLLDLVLKSENGSMLVFTKTRRKATWVAGRLRDANIAAEEIHGDISQAQREKTMARYREGTFNVLVATDVAARGLDVPSISHVVNYDLPLTASDYVHRIGRTGRAGRTGVAHSFVSEDQRYLIRDIEKVIGRRLDPNGAPDMSTGPRPSARPKSRRPTGRRRPA